MIHESEIRCPSRINVGQIPSSLLRGRGLETMDSRDDRSESTPEEIPPSTHEDGEGTDHREEDTYGDEV